MPGSTRLGQILLVSSLALGAFVLGMAGFAAHSPAPDSWSTLAYLAIQLFVLQSGAVSAPIPWQLDVARYLAPGVAAYATLRVLADLLRDQIDAVAIALLRRHTIVCGDTDVALRLAAALRADGDRVALIHRSAAPAMVASLRHAGVRVAAADASDPMTLKRSGIARASRVVVAEASDADTARVALAVHRAGGEAAHALVCFVMVGNAELCRLLRARHTRGAAGALRVEYVNLAECAAVALAQEHPAPTGTGPVVVAGDSTLADHLVMQLWGTPPRRTVLRTIATGQLPTQTAAAYVCMADDDEGLRIGLTIAADSEAPIVIAQQRPSGLGDLLGLSAAGPADPRVTIFPVLDRACRPAILLREVHEALATALHDRYVEHEQRAGTAAGNPSAVPWTALPESVRRANREQARNLSQVLEQAGFGVIPASVRPAGPVELTGAEVEAVARAEHERWVEERRRDNWRHAPGPKNVVARTHPDLVEWERLEEPSREKTRAIARSLPAMLPRVGLAIVRRRSAESPRHS